MDIRLIQILKEFITRKQILLPTIGLCHFMGPFKEKKIKLGQNIKQRSLK